MRRNNVLPHVIQVILADHGWFDHANVTSPGIALPQQGPWPPPSLQYFAIILQKYTNQSGCFRNGVIPS
jgi:hypothetical protein